MENHTYKGFNIYRAPFNLAGCRWEIFLPNRGFVLVETLAMAKEAINEHVKSHN